MEVKNGAHAQIQHLASVPTSSEEVGYLVMRTEDVDKFYNSVQKELTQLFHAKAGNVFFVFIPPKVSERFAENGFHIFRTDKKKMKRPDVIVGKNHSLILIRKYTLMP